MTCDMWWGVNILSEFQLPSSFGLGVMITAKPADRQKSATILGASWAKQSISLQCEFLWESLPVPSDLHWPSSTGQCSVTALGPLLFSLPSANDTIPLVSAIV